MIIPGNAVLSMPRPPPEPQGLREEESDFGQVLTEIEHQTKSLPDQEDGERRALESVLQVLMSLFQSFTPASSATAGATPEAGEPGVMSAGLAGGPALGWPPGLAPAAGLGETEYVNLPPGLIPDASPDIGLSTVPATAVLPTALSLAARGSSTTGALLDLPMASPPTPQLGTPSGAAALDTTASFSGDSVMATAARSHPLSASIQPAGSSTPDRELRSPVGPTPVGPTSVDPTSVDPTPVDPTSVDPTPVDPTPVDPTQPEGAAVSFPALPQADTAAQVVADRYGLRATSGVKGEGVLAEREPALAPSRAPESTERASDAMPSVPYLAADGAFPAPVTRATSHTSADGSDTPVPPPSRSLEDVTASRQWPRPGPANTMWLHLDPPELGALLVQVRVSEKRLIASFRAQSPEAEALLRMHLPALHESLSQQGFEVRPMVVTQASEGFSNHLGAGTGAFTQQHSSSQGFTQDRQATGAEGVQHDLDLHRTVHWPAEQKPRLLDVMV